MHRGPASLALSARTDAAMPDRIVRLAPGSVRRNVALTPAACFDAREMFLRGLKMTAKNDLEGISLVFRTPRQSPKNRLYPPDPMKMRGHRVCTAGAGTM